MLTNDFANSLKVFIPGTDSIHIYLVGCGGTGSWLAPAITRTARLLMDNGKKVSVTFVDPDAVEEKNVYRQNFCRAEVGRNKAETLAYRFGAAWGVDVRAIDRKFTRDIKEYSGETTIICGCVDRASSRKAIKENVSWYSRYYWLDAGNSKSSGQVLFGGPVIDSKIENNPLLLPGLTTWLPLPSKIHPELIVSEAAPTQPSPSANSADGEDTQGLSCADMALRDSQGMAINQRMAAEMADYLIRLLITKDLRKYATYVDLETGSCQSKYITAEVVKKWLESKN